ncbi:hypothetical protein, partial [Oceanobacillus oncorhynchi]
FTSLKFLEPACYFLSISLNAVTNNTPITNEGVNKMEEAPTSNNGMNTSNNGMSTSNKINLTGLGVGAIVLTTVYTAVLASQLMATKHKVDYLYYKELTQNK